MILNTIDERIYNIIMEPDVAVGIVIGGIRKGKSVLGYGSVEELYLTAHRQVFEFGLPGPKEHLLPSHLKPIHDLDCLPDGCGFLVDEAYREFYARESMKQGNKFIDTLAALSGQKRLKSLYITQQARRLDRGIVGAVDFILFKKPSLLQIEFDRTELKKILIQVYKAFGDLKPPAGTDLNTYQKRCTYVLSENFVGMIENSNREPCWWSDDLSRAYAGISLKAKQNDAKAREKEALHIISQYINGDKKRAPAGPYIPKSQRIPIPEVRKDE